MPGGATAFVPALVNSGLPCDRFCFEGFLPHKKGRQTKLENLVKEERTMVFYESPHRLIKTLSLFQDYFGKGQEKPVLAGKLSKFYEENKRGTIEELLAYFSAKTIKGEIVIVVQGLTKS